VSGTPSDLAGQIAQAKDHLNALLDALANRKGSTPLSVIKAKLEALADELGRRQIALDRAAARMAELEEARAREEARAGEREAALRKSGSALRVLRADLANASAERDRLRALAGSARSEAARLGRRVAAQSAEIEAAHAAGIRARSVERVLVAELDAVAKDRERLKRALRMAHRRIESLRYLMRERDAATDAAGEQAAQLEQSVAQLRSQLQCLLAEEAHLASAEQLSQEIGPRLPVPDTPDAPRNRENAPQGEDGLDVATRQARDLARHVARVRHPARRDVGTPARTPCESIGDRDEALLAAGEEKGRLQERLSRTLARVEDLEAKLVATEHRAQRGAATEADFAAQVESMRAEKVAASLALEEARIENSRLVTRLRKIEAAQHELERLSQATGQFDLVDARPGPDRSVETIRDRRPAAPDTVVFPAHDEYGRKRRLGEILVRAGVLDHAQLDACLREQERQGQGPIGGIIVKYGYVSEDMVARALASQLRLPYTSLAYLEPSPGVTGLIPVSLALKHTCVPVHAFDDRIEVAMANPLDLLAMEDIELATGHRVEPIIGAPTAIREAITRLYRP